jgi:hypothetical protein
LLFSLRQRGVILFAPVAYIPLLGAVDSTPASLCSQALQPVPFAPSADFVRL